MPTDIKPSDYAHIHLHSEYSTLDGINRIDTLPEYIKSIGQEACAITDHGNVSGAHKFYKACNKAGIKPIIGMEAYYTLGDHTVKEVDHTGERYHHLILLAKNSVGLTNLYKLSSLAYIEGLYYKPRISDLLLADYSEGIIATSACLGSAASQLILRGDRVAARKLLEHHAAIFKDRFFIELQLHDGEQRLVNEVLTSIASEYNWPIVLTNDCHYTHKHDKHIHEIALCMQTNDTMSNPKRFTFGDIDVHVANCDYMVEGAKAANIPLESIKNTRYVSDMVEGYSDYYDNIRNRYPKYQGLPEGTNSWDYLEWLAKTRLFDKMGSMPPELYKQRMNEELRVIKRMGFSDYMLIDAELVHGARSIGVTVGPGRGSAAGSLVAYALGITAVDPLKYDLVFERFLNEGRAANPIIFDSNTRNEIKAKLAQE